MPRAVHTEPRAKTLSHPFIIRVYNGTVDTGRNANDAGAATSARISEEDPFPQAIHEAAPTSVGEPLSEPLREKPCRQIT